MGFLVLEWWFLMVWKVVKCLISVGFVEVGIEVILVIFWCFDVGWGVIFGKLNFWSQGVDGTDSLVFAAEHLFWNVNYAPCIGFLLYNLYIVHFCNLNIDYLSSENALQLAITPAWFLSLTHKHMYFYQRQKNVRLCPSLEYTRKNQKCHSIPKITLFSPLKWWLIPNLHQKTYSKWGLHAKYRIQYHHKYVHHTKTLHCPPHTNKSPIMSVPHVHIKIQ